MSHGSGQIGLRGQSGLSRRSAWRERGRIVSSISRLDYQSRDYRPFSTLPSVTPSSSTLPQTTGSISAVASPCHWAEATSSATMNQARPMGSFAGVQMAFGRLLTSVTGPLRSGGRTQRSRSSCNPYDAVWQRAFRQCQLRYRNQPITCRIPASA